MCSIISSSIFAFRLSEHAQVNSWLTASPKVTSLAALYEKIRQESITTVAPTDLHKSLNLCTQFASRSPGPLISTILGPAVSDPPWQKLSRSNLLSNRTVLDTGSMEYIHAMKTDESEPLTPPHNSSHRWYQSLGVEDWVNSLQNSLEAIHHVTSPHDKIKAEYHVNTHIRSIASSPRSRPSSIIGFLSVQEQSIAQPHATSPLSYTNTDYVPSSLRPKSASMRAHSTPSLVRSQTLHPDNPDFLSNDLVTSQSEMNINLPIPTIPLRLETGTESEHDLPTSIPTAFHRRRETARPKGPRSMSTNVS